MKDFDRWSERHATIFGLKGDEWLRMLVSWEAVFDACGYVASDLEAATTRMAQNPPQRPWDHLAAIHRQVRDHRSIEHRRQLDANEQTLGTCTTCGGAGRVVVPQLQAVQDGEWRPLKKARAGASWYTMAVLCRCALGRWYEARLTGERERMLRLDEYEALNPRWRIQMLQQARENREVLASMAPRRNDRDTRLADVMRALEQQFGIREPGVDGEESAEGNVNG